MILGEPDELKLSRDGVTETVIACYGNKFIELSGQVSGVKAVETETDGVVAVDVRLEGFTVQRVWEEQ